MSKPTILAVDDDAQVLAAIGRDLRERYGADYRIVRASSGAEALTVLAELVLRDRPVALVVTDQRMPGMSGIEMLGQANIRGRVGEPDGPDEHRDAEHAEHARDDRARRHQRGGAPEAAGRTCGGAGRRQRCTHG